MAKKSDICETCDTKGTKDCIECPDYDICDNCGRRTCNYVSVHVEEELWCRVCCKEKGFTDREIKTQICQL